MNIQNEQSTGQEPKDTMTISTPLESTFPQSGAKILTENQVKESSQRLQNEVNEAVEKKKRGRGRPPSATKKDIPKIGQSTPQVVAMPQAQKIPVEVLKPWLNSGFNFLATIRKCDAYKLPDDTCTELATQTQIILQHLETNINPFYAACFSAVTIAGMHCYGAYMIEKEILEQKAKQNAIAS